MDTFKRNLIYALRDPRNDVTCYVGKTTVGKSRPISHLTQSHSERVNDWVKELNAVGYEPIIDILEDGVELSELRNREIYWIEYHKNINPDLLNCNYNVSQSILSFYDISDEELKIFIKIIANLPKAIKGWRKKYSISQEDLAKKIEVDRSTLSKLENGGNVCIDTIIKLVNYLQEVAYESEGKYE
jgi:DNA-binding XRE family transcriptional regulator